MKLLAEPIWEEAEWKRPTPVQLQRLVGRQLALVGFDATGGDSVARLSDEIVSVLRRMIVSSPYGDLLGLEWVEAREDCVRLRLPYREEVTTVGDTVHGGAIASLVDAAATASFWASPQVSPGSRGTTIGFSISFVSAGRGKDLVATARVRRRGREISTGEVAVTDTEGREVAVALVTYKLSASA